MTNRNNFWRVEAPTWIKAEAQPHTPHASLPLHHPVLKSALCFDWIEFCYCCCVSSVDLPTLTGDEPAEGEAGHQRVPKDADAAEEAGRSVAVLTGAGQAGEQRQRHPEDAHHNQVDGDVGLPRTVMQVDCTCRPNNRTITDPAALRVCFPYTLGLSRRWLTDCNVGNGEDAQSHLGRHCKKKTFFVCLFCDATVAQPPLRNACPWLSTSGGLTKDGRGGLRAVFKACDQPSAWHPNSWKSQTPNRKKRNKCRGQLWGNRKEMCVRCGRGMGGGGNEWLLNVIGCNRDKGNMKRFLIRQIKKKPTITMSTGNGKTLVSLRQIYF